MGRFAELSGRVDRFNKRWEGWLLRHGRWVGLGFGALGAVDMIVKGAHWFSVIAMFSFGVIYGEAAQARKHREGAGDAAP